MRKAILALFAVVFSLTCLSIWQWCTAHTIHRDNPFNREEAHQAQQLEKLRRYNGGVHRVEDVRFFSSVETHHGTDTPADQDDEHPAVEPDEEDAEDEELGHGGEVGEPSARSTGFGSSKVQQPLYVPLHGDKDSAEQEGKKEDKKEKKDKEEDKDKNRKTNGGSGGGKKTNLHYNMYKNGFTGSFVMNKAKYQNEKKGSPVRVAKFMIQCLDKSPPRGCDMEAAKQNRGRGWQRVARISKEFLSTLPDNDQFRDRLDRNKKYSSCAVVGNGGSLLLYEAGPEIDRHDMVLRFNGGITKKFEKHVGSKTTLRLTNTQHMGFHEREDEVVLQHITMEGAMDKLAKVRQEHPKLKLFATDGDFHQHVLDTMGDGAASNGFFGMVLAYELCDKVTLYGFHKSWKEGDSEAGVTKTKYHYYDQVEPNESQTKRDNAETPRLFAFLERHQDVFSFGEQELERHMKSSKDPPTGEGDLFTKDLED